MEIEIEVVHLERLRHPTPEAPSNHRDPASELRVQCPTLPAPVAAGACGCHGACGCPTLSGVPAPAPVAAMAPVWPVAPAPVAAGACVLYGLPNFKKCGPNILYGRPSLKGNSKQQPAS